MDIMKQSRSEARRMSKTVITISYGDYTRGSGGTDKFILSQQKIFYGHGYNCIHFYTFQHSFWNVLYNGKFYGIYSNKRAKRLLYRTKEIAAIFIHHLKNVNTELLSDILDYCDVPIFYYLHDYYTICPISGLVRENGVFCGSGFPSEKKCGGCSFYSKSAVLSEKVRKLLKTYRNRITFIAPSDAAKEVWLKEYPEYRGQVRVIYHQNLMGYYGNNHEPIRHEAPIKVAFVGYQRPHKGWGPFRDAATKASQLGLNEQFFQFGWGNEKFPYIEQVDVDFKKSLTAMTDALREHQIHVAVLWSTWPETYAYTYYESLAANCFVVTNRMSGNVCAQVEERKNGIVVDDLSEILCAEERLRMLVNTFRTNGHITPDVLKESEEFLSLINDTDWKPPRLRKVLDQSTILTILKKVKRTLVLRGESCDR